MEDRVTINIENGVADVRLARPDKMNALDEKMFQALVAAGERLKTERQVRAVVLSGEGPAFCAGLDTSQFHKMRSGERKGGADLVDVPRTPRGANSHQQAVMVWREVPVPVIAAVHGHAYGGGFQLTLGPDIRFIAPSTKMAILEVKWGLVPDMGGYVLMRGLLRDDIARDLTYSARIFSGEEAGRLGLATRVCDDPRTEALAYAAEIASKSPDAIRTAKRLFDLSTLADEATLLKAESVENAPLIGSPNQVEAVRAGLEKTVANFKD